jgi:hypothetical protein
MPYFVSLWERLLAPRLDHLKSIKAKPIHCLIANLKWCFENVASFMTIDLCTKSYSHPCFKTSGLYYKPIMIVNDDSRLVNKLETSLTDNARVVNYNCRMFIVLATESSNRAYALNQRCRGRDQIQADVQTML